MFVTGGADAQRDAVVLEKSFRTWLGRTPTLTRSYPHGLPSSLMPFFDWIEEGFTYQNW